MESFSFSAILPTITTAKNRGQSIVFATGVFDLLHQEHINFLTKAKARGDLLIVGIESDARVKQIKGPSRPINPQHSRAAAVNKLKAVDFAFILPERFSLPSQHQRLISQIKPDILAVSSHSPHLAQKRRILHQFGGQVKIVHQHNPHLSTTKMLQSKGRN